MAVVKQNAINVQTSINADGFALTAGTTPRSLTISGGDASVNQNVTTTGAPTFGNITDSGLTASKPVFTDGDKKLVSTGTMPADQGGTGQTSYSDGELLIGNSTGNTLVKATLTEGTGISITNGSGSITIACTIAGLTWTTVTSDVSPAAIGTGYFANLAAGGVPLNITLPTTFAVGDTIAIAGQGSEGWKVTAGVGTAIQFGNVSTKTAGYIASSNQYDSIVLVGMVANTTWAVQSSIGNLTVEIS